MGKAGRWIRGFLLGKKEKRIGNQTTEEFPVVDSLPPPKDKRRWSYQKPAVPAKGRNSTDIVAPQLVRQLSESEIGARRAMAIELAMGGAAVAAATVASQTATAPRRRSSRTSRGINRAIMEVAAVKIQSVFRSYLARRALSALKGLVQLQAMVRGHLVRKQATAALQCMQSLVMAQARARSQRMRMVEAAQDSLQQQPIRRRASHDFQYQKTYTRQVSIESYSHEFVCEMSRNSEDDVKIVEMDYGEPRGSFKSRNNYTITERRDHNIAAYFYDQEQYQQFSPVRPAIIDVIPRGYIEHSGEFPFTRARGSPRGTSRGSPRGTTAVSITDATQTSLGNSTPSYMANTESSRAKTRSHSAPKQRPDSYERLNSGRRQSVEGRNNSRGPKMQRASSHTSLAAKGNQYPRSIKLDQSSMSINDSEYGSTGSKVTSANYCRAQVAYQVQIH